MINWIFIVLAHWNNSPPINMSPHSDTSPWFRANQSLLFTLNAACLTEKQQNTNFIVFGLTGLEPMIYHTRGEHANHYTTDAILLCSLEACPLLKQCPTIDTMSSWISDWHKNKNFVRIQLRNINALIGFKSIRCFREEEFSNISSIKSLAILHVCPELVVILDFWY